MTYLHCGCVTVIAHLPVLTCLLQSPMHGHITSSGEVVRKKVGRQTCFCCLTGPVLLCQHVMPCAGIIVTIVVW